MWGRKTEHLSAEEWANGFVQIEAKVANAAQNDETAFPPTYAEFVGICKKIKVSDKRAEGKIFYKNYLLPEPPEMVAKRKENGSKRMRAILDIVNE